MCGSVAVNVGWQRNAMTLRGPDDHMPSIAEVVAEARRLTNKPSTPNDTPNDALLIEYLKAQEVTSAADFSNLSDESFTLIMQHPSVTMVMADALRLLRRNHEDVSSTVAVIGTKVDAPPRWHIRPHVPPACQLARPAAHLPTAYLFLDFGDIS